MFRRWLSAHPRAVDGVIVGTYLFGCLLMAVFELLTGYAATSIPDADPGLVDEVARFAPLATWPWTIVRIGITAVVAVALAYRRSHTLAGVIAVSLLLALEQGMLAVPNSVALVFLLYAAPVYRGVVTGWIAYGCAVALSTPVMLFGAGGSGLFGPAGILAGPSDRSETLVLAILNALWLLVVLMIGINLGNRRRYVEALIERAHQLVIEREQRAQLAAAAERARIAREMHDIVAHSLSVVVTLSEAASVSIDSQPHAAKQAMRRAAETGRGALVEMRRLLGVLSEGEAAGGSGDASTAGRPGAAALSPAPLEPQPDARQLQQLVRGFRDAGLEIAFTEQGVAAGDATQQLAVFRIAQEALTNALRHGGRGAEVRLVVEHRPELTRIEVTDRAGAASRAAQTIPGAGRGLAGAAERARMFGGEFEAGPQADGWRVVATVPVETVSRAAAGETEPDERRER